MHLRAKAEETTQMLTALQEIIKAKESHSSPKLDWSALDGFQKLMRENANNLNKAMSAWNKSILASIQPLNSLSQPFTRNTFTGYSGISYGKILLESNLAKIDKLMKESPSNQIDWGKVLQERFSVDENGGVFFEKPEEIDLSQLATKQDIEELKSTILGNLNDKSKEISTIDKLMYFIAIFTFLQGVITQLADLNNSQVLEETQQSIENLQKSLFEKIEQELHLVYDSRVARVEADLKSAPKKGSGVIGIVCKGQKVTVVEIQHKYLYITFLDIDTCEPKTGFVLKKYFEIIGH